VVRCCTKDTDCTTAPQLKCYGAQENGETVTPGQCVECYQNEHCTDGKTCDTASTMKCVSAEEEEKKKKKDSALMKASLILLVVIASMILNL